ncbi:Hly-III family protein [Arthrobacter crystallopoietes BAB-32]|uniref:Hly-III family protein n=1 Tax=Arthrobacter crystallopoietes BAB-32 TaxID=1246476 RepID=N1V3U5_9MICC|nr:hemolysin III family protein [Arthrobacter crystallopoietes]EMY36030.1 Hly-III family protein [Arthrobacter crystallopoietes BAB-32]
MNPRGAAHSSQPAGGPDGIDGPIETAVENLADALSIKPKFRGWLHAGATPLALIAGIVLVSLAPSAPGKATSAIYALTGLLLFGTSAVYHRGNWQPKAKLILRRLDHSNIMLVIAGTYTPLAWALLEPAKGTILLWLIWCGAIAGVAFRVIWPNAPRWLYVPIYCALGLAALFYLPDFFAANAPAAVLICVGGAFYIAGAVFYGIKKPNFSATWFGFHELFHAFTVVAFTCHFIAIMLAVLAQGA